MTIVARPVGEYVLVRPIEAPKTFAEGQLFLPEGAVEKPQQGVVLALGRGIISTDGFIVEHEVQEGDTIVFTKYGGTEVNVGGEQFFIIKESDVLLIISDEPEEEAQPA